MRQVGTRKALHQKSRKGFTADSVVISQDGIKTGRYCLARDEPGGCPDRWPGGARRRGGASLVCGFRAERGMACPILPPLGGRREGELQASETRGAEYRCVARRRTGP
jgi:hypothetical protein